MELIIKESETFSKLIELNGIEDLQWHCQNSNQSLTDIVKNNSGSNMFLQKVEPLNDQIYEVFREGDLLLAIVNYEDFPVYFEITIGNNRWRKQVSPKTISPIFDNTYLNLLKSAQTAIYWKVKTSIFNYKKKPMNIAFICGNIAERESRLSNTQNHYVKSRNYWIYYRDGDVKISETDLQIEDLPFADIKHFSIVEQNADEEKEVQCKLVNDGEKVHEFEILNTNYEFKHFYITTDEPFNTNDVYQITLKLDCKKRCYYAKINGHFEQIILSKTSLL